MADSFAICNQDRDKQDGMVSSKRSRPDRRRLNANTSPSSLQMFVGGVEVPIKVNSANGIYLASADSIEFYGVALDTPTSDTQIYWLASGLGTGKRINVQRSPGSSSGNGSSSFPYTVERKNGVSISQVSGMGIKRIGSALWCDQPIIGKHQHS